MPDDHDLEWEPGRVATAIAEHPGDLKAQLEAVRDALAAEMDQDPKCAKCGGGISSPTATLAKQLTDILVRLAALKVPEVSARDELKAARDARRSAAGAPDGAKLPKDQRTGGSRPRRKRGAAS